MGVINNVSDKDLREYLPTKGDRVAIQAFVYSDQTENDKWLQTLGFEWNWHEA